MMRDILVISTPENAIRSKGWAPRPEFYTGKSKPRNSASAAIQRRALVRPQRVGGCVSPPRLLKAPSQPALAAALWQ